MKIKFLVINGSERTNGNTEFAINIAKEILINVSKKEGLGTSIKFL